MPDNRIYLIRKEGVMMDNQSSSKPAIPVSPEKYQKLTEINRKRQN